MGHLGTGGTAPEWTRRRGLAPRPFLPGGWRPAAQRAPTRIQHLNRAAPEGDPQLQLPGSRLLPAPAKGRGGSSGGSHRQEEQPPLPS